MNEENLIRKGRHPLLEVKNLKVRFASDLGAVSAVNGLDIAVQAGESLVILGESGSGKSVAAQAIMGVIPTPPGTVDADRLRLNEIDLLTLSPNQHRTMRGKEMALIFQDALTSLNPRFTIGTQICQMLRHHLKLSKKLARLRAIELLEKVGIPAPEDRLDAYPHQLSGGMRQRALIALSIAISPKLLIADEPTTALDVTVQAQVLDLIETLQADAGMGLILITHDLSVAQRVADTVAVMYAGKIVETAPKAKLFSNPSHPYTQGLIRSTPRASDIGKSLTPIVGSPPDLRNLPKGCAFAPRCPKAQSVCSQEAPVNQLMANDHFSRCHFAGEPS